MWEAIGGIFSGVYWDGGGGGVRVARGGRKRLSSAVLPFIVERLMRLIVGGGTLPLNSTLCCVCSSGLCGSLLSGDAGL